MLLYNIKKFCLNTGFESLKLENMKRSQLHILTILFFSLLIFTACSKKDREPTLIVTVQGLNGTPLEGATVHVWPTEDIAIDTTNDGTPIPRGDRDEAMDKTGVTDALGEITFVFPFSAVLDVDVIYTLATSDSTSSILEGHKVVKIEVIEQKEEENIFNELVYVE